jgi:hypothetical protein
MPLLFSLTLAFVVVCSHRAALDMRSEYEKMRRDRDLWRQRALVPDLCHQDHIAPQHGGQGVKALMGDTLQSRG